MQMINGRVLARRIRDKVGQMVKSLPTQPGMAAILVGNDPPSHIYVNLKEKACQEVGIRFEKLLYPEDVPQQTLIDKIQELNNRADINGILVQLPLPNQDANAVIAAIDPNKDIDGFHPENLRRLEAGEPSLVPPVALGIMKLIDEAQKETDRASTPHRAALICSEIFGRPLKALLKEHQVEIVSETKDADIVIVAIGKPQSIKGTELKNGAVIIDVGTTRVGDKLLGDVDADSTSGLEGLLTPVPGGVGPMTVAMLTLNVIKAYRIHTPKH